MHPNWLKKCEKKNPYKYFDFSLKINRVHLMRIQGPSIGISTSTSFFFLLFFRYFFNRTWSACIFWYRTKPHTQSRINGKGTENVSVFRIYILIWNGPKLLAYIFHLLIANSKDLITDKRILVGKIKILIKKNALKIRKAIQRVFHHKKTINFVHCIRSMQ